MPDVEQVLMGIKSVESAGIQCPLNDIEPRCLRFPQSLIDDVVELLKKQEPKEPIVTENHYGWKFYHCPRCGKEFFGNNKAKYCDKCGQAVEWELVSLTK